MKARLFRTCGMLLTCASLSVFAACGDDSDTDAGVIGGTGGSAGASGAAGGAGTAGKAGGTAGGGAVTCGGTACKVNDTLKLINAAAAACCTVDSKCGQYNTAMKCLLNAAPGTPDTSCPGVPVMALGMSLTQPGCCTPAKQCGADYTGVGYGCVARQDIDMAMGGPFPALACGAGGGDSGADAGL